LDDETSWTRWKNKDCKNDTTDTGQRKYRQLRQEVRRLCRRAKDEFTNNKCSEIEKLEATHNPLLKSQEIKEMIPKKYINTQSIKDKHGNVLHDPKTYWKDGHSIWKNYTTIQGAPPI